MEFTAIEIKVDAETVVRRETSETTAVSASFSGQTSPGANVAVMRSPGEVVAVASRSLPCTFRVASPKVIVCGEPLTRTVFALISGNRAQLREIREAYAMLLRNLEPYAGRYLALNAAIWSHVTTLMFDDETMADGLEWGRTVSAKAKTGRAGTGQDFLEALAQALGKAIDDKMGQMMDTAQQIDQQTQSANSANASGGNQQPVIAEMSAKVQALGQEISLLSNALDNSIKSIGESSSTLAKKD